MTRYQMMDKIAKTLKKGERLEVRVSHCGNWGGANIYTLTRDGIQDISHRWHTTGNIRSIYAERMLGH